MGGAYLNMGELRNANKSFVERTWSDEISVHVGPLDRPRYAKDSNNQTGWRAEIIIYIYSDFKIIYACYSVNT